MNIAQQLRDRAQLHTILAEKARRAGQKDQMAEHLKLTQALSEKAQQIEAAYEQWSGIVSA
jgi:hypothetical protein